MELSLILKYDIVNDEFDLAGNIKEEKRKEVISDFLRTQFSAGEDDREPKVRDNYNIKIDVCQVC